MDQPSAPSPQHVPFLAIGRLLGPMGIHGDLRVEVLTDYPERFGQLSRVFVGDRLQPFDVVRAHADSAGAVIHLSGVDNPSAATKLADELFYVAAADAYQPNPDEFFWHQVVGLDVVTTEGVAIGRVIDILRTGANDVYIVEGPLGEEILLPATEEVVQTIDLEHRLMIVTLLPGLI